MSNVEKSYHDLLGLLRDTALMGSCANVLGWDEQTNLPPAGGQYRSEQLALLAGLTHERATSPRIGDLLAELEQSGQLGDANSPMAVNVREQRQLFGSVLSTGWRQIGLLVPAQDAGA